MEVRAVPNAPPINTNLVSNDGSTPRKGKTCTAKNRDSDASRPCKMGGVPNREIIRGPLVCEAVSYCLVIGLFIWQFLGK